MPGFEPFRAMAISLATACAAGDVGLAVQAAALNPTMEPHAAFSSAETQQAKPVDPQVFVRDPADAAGTGPQNIAYDAGFRLALLGDAPQSQVFNARGKALGFTLGDWLGAKGTAAIAEDGKTVAVQLEGLRPDGTYSLCENHFDQQPVGFTPLDGTESSNSFVAQPNGTACVTATAPERPTHANAVLLVYRSDNASQACPGAGSAS